MLQNPGPLHEAEMKLEFRRLYKEQGFELCMQVLFEILKSGEWLSEVMLEERGKEQGCGCDATAACAFHSGHDQHGL